ncbi:aspartate kinase [Alkalibacillus aidingensis]|uniref:aspartate kinase n=1 Tax=Alkalibacillus aidingensis TaxID=2747607 RepID=UPI001660F3D0|nr:aspartate kinase [Alkalibacillus aidingensis]
MGLIIQKFGGTSVRNPMSREHAINQVEHALRDGDQVVVVVSAMGRKGEPYATDSLLELIQYPQTAVSNREVDLLASCGEIISTVVFTHELRKLGITAAAMTGPDAGFLTTSEYTNAKISKVNTSKLKEYMKVNEVVVVAGFQGKNEEGNITTLGRGGSDTSAVALGAALGADYVDIFTDVDGIKTADPLLVKEAKTIKAVTYHEIVHLAYQGTKVIHPRAVEIAMQEKIPLRVRSTYSEEEGTLVASKVDSSMDAHLKERLVTGIAYVANITQIKVLANKEPIQLHQEVLQQLAKAGISVDFFNIATEGLTFTVPNARLSEAVQIIEVLGYDVQLEEDCAKVSTVGAAIQGVPGVASKVVNALAKHGIQILQSADSHTTIWVLVKESELETAVNALHDEFLSFNND